MKLRIRTSIGMTCNTRSARHMYCNRLIISLDNKSPAIIDLNWMQEASPGSVLFYDSKAMAKEFLRWLSIPSGWSMSAPFFFFNLTNIAWDGGMSRLNSPFRCRTHAFAPAQSKITDTGGTVVVWQLQSSISINSWFKDTTAFMKGSCLFGDWCGKS